MLNLLKIQESADASIVATLKPYKELIQAEIEKMCKKYSLEYYTGMGTWFFTSTKRKDRNSED